MKPLGWNTQEDTDEYRRLLYKQEQEDRRKAELERMRRADLGSRSIEQLQELLQALVKEELVTFLADPEVHIRSVIYSELRKIVLTLIGVDAAWSDWRIKDNSPVGNQVGNMVLAQLQLALPDFIRDLSVSAETREKITKTMTADYEQRLRDQVGRELESWITTEAKKVSSAVIDNLVKKKVP